MTTQKTKQTILQGINQQILDANPSTLTLAELRTQLDLIAHTNDPELVSTNIHQLTVNKTTAGIRKVILN